jgi:hypothetical protein
MAAEFFTHLGIACAHLKFQSARIPIDPVVVMKPGGRKSGVGTPFSVSDVVRMETTELLRLATEEGDFGATKQEALKVLVRPEVLQ